MLNQVFPTSYNNNESVESPTRTFLRSIVTALKSFVFYIRMSGTVIFSLGWNKLSRPLGKEAHGQVLEERTHEQLVTCVTGASAAGGRAGGGSGEEIGRVAGAAWSSEAS